MAQHIARIDDVYLGTHMGFGCGVRSVLGLARAVLVVLIALVVTHPSQAAEQNFENWKAAFRIEALSEGISATIFDQAMGKVVEIPRVIELDRKQPEFSLTFNEYLTRVVPEARVKKARQRLAENKQILEQVGTRLGVQPRFIVAFWGIETDFGRLTGGFKVVDALATLAYDGRRSAYFRKELLNALKILDEGHIGVEDMKGSWAGAMGQCQFMPSSFLNFAIDYDGDGHKNIWTSKPDVFGSAANYLAKSGWKNDQTWGRPVILPDGFDLSLTGLKKEPRLLSEWQTLGVRKADGAALPNRGLPAWLVLADDKTGPAFLVYNNFKTILKWNRSTYFAVAVGTLADRIGGR